MATVLASLGPIVAFFSLSTTSYPFMLLFNVAVFSVSGVLGLTFLLQTLQHERRRSSTALGAGFQGTGLGSVDRPGSRETGRFDRASRSARQPGFERARQGGLPNLGDRLSRWSESRIGLGASAVHRQPEPAVHLVPRPGIQFLPGDPSCVGKFVFLTGDPGPDS